MNFNYKQSFNNTNSYGFISTLNYYHYNINIDIILENYPAQLKWSRPLSNKEYLLT